MSRLVALTGTEANRLLKAAQVKPGEVHSTSDQKRLFLENEIVAPLWLGVVANQAAQLALNAGVRGCWPGDKCRRADIGTIWECVASNGATLADWVEITTDRIGTITLWSGAFADIPTGWHLCDGTGGTPNLADRFILGTATGADVGTTGGASQHKHSSGTLAADNASAGTPAGTVSAPTFTGGAVTAGTTNPGAHLVAADTSPAGVSPITTATGTVSAPGFTGTPMGNHSHTISGKTADAENGAGSTAAADILPPWYKLAYIKRVS